MWCKVPWSGPLLAWIGVREGFHRYCTCSGHKLAVLFRCAIIDHRVVDVIAKFPWQLMQGEVVDAFDLECGKAVVVSSTAGVAPAQHCCLFESWMRPLPSCRRHAERLWGNPRAVGPRMCGAVEWSSRVADVEGNKECARATVASFTLR